MSKIGVLVANASRARFIHYHGINHAAPLEVLELMVHPESRLKREELVSDRPGHFQTPQHSRGAYGEDRDPKQETKEHFAMELAKKLEQYRKQNHYNKFLIVAPAPFYGLIEKHLTKEMNNLLFGHLQKDYTEYHERDLFPMLREALVPKM